VTGPGTFLGGTGLYQGIAGMVNLTESLVWILSRYTSGTDKGQCNGNQVSFFFASITGAGTASL